MTILNLCSVLVLLYSLSMLGPVAIGLIEGESDVSSFLLTFIAALAIGTAGWLCTRGAYRPLKARDGFLIAVLFWLIFSAFSATPLLIDPRVNLRAVDAIEGISGITTTGASVLSDIDFLPKSILYYRAQLNFLGGLGIIVLAIAILPLLGVGGAKLYQSETSGPLKDQATTSRQSSRNFALTSA